MPTLVMLEVKAKADAVKALRTLTTAGIPHTRAFAGCQGATAYVSQDDPQTLVLVAQWDNRDAYERYLAWRTENGSLAQLMSLLDGPPSIRFFAGVDA